MIAGASGIDLVLLVVAADDGVMPQTREHLAVLRPLGVDRGLVAVTKCDLADAELRRLAAEDCELLAPGRRGSRSAPAAARASRRCGRRWRGRGEDPVPRRAGRRRRAAAARRPRLHHRRPRHGRHRHALVGRCRATRRWCCCPGEPGRGCAGSRSTAAGSSAPPPASASPSTCAGCAATRSPEATSPSTAAPPADLPLDVELGPGAEGILAERRVQVHLGSRESPARVVDLGSGAAQLRLERRLIARRRPRRRPPHRPARHARRRPRPRPLPRPPPRTAAPPPRPGARASHAGARAAPAGAARPPRARRAQGDGLRPAPRRAGGGARAPGRRSTAPSASWSTAASWSAASATCLPERALRPVAPRRPRPGRRDGSTSIAELRDALASAASTRRRCSSSSTANAPCAAAATATCRPGPGP